MPPKAAAEKKPASKAPASKAPAEKKEAGKKTAATGDKKKRTKTRKETYSSYIYKGTNSFRESRVFSKHLARPKDRDTASSLLHIHPSLPQSRLPF
jgi:histone H2B